jgi:hypothetical protein
VWRVSQPCGHARRWTTNKSAQLKNYVSERAVRRLLGVTRKPLSRLIYGRHLNNRITN